MREKGFDSPYLHWYVDYACRDDYGGAMGDMSAWAGIYYFAARGSKEDTGPFTRPEGNGWIVKKLLASWAASCGRTRRWIAILREGHDGTRVPTDDDRIFCRRGDLRRAIIAREVSDGRRAAGAQP